MKLNIEERLMLLGVLPQEGNFVTLKIVRKLKEELSFSEEELAKYKIVQDPKNNQVKWNAEADSKDQKDIKMGGEATALIVKSLKDLDKDNKLVPQQLSLYEKFMTESSE